jgi:hypothetical protein
VDCGNQPLTNVTLSSRTTDLTRSNDVCPKRPPQNHARDSISAPESSDVSYGSGPPSGAVDWDTNSYGEPERGPPTVLHIVPKTACTNDLGTNDIGSREELGDVVDVRAKHSVDRVFMIGKVIWNTGNNIPAWFYK